MGEEEPNDALSLISGEPTSPLLRERARAMKLLGYAKFIISMVVVCSYVGLLSYPIAIRDIDLLKTVASILAGPVGMVIGYYFGTERT